MYIVELVLHTLSPSKNISPRTKGSQAYISRNNISFDTDLYYFSCNKQVMSWIYILCCINPRLSISSKAYLPKGWYRLIQHVLHVLACHVHYIIYLTCVRYRICNIQPKNKIRSINCSIQSLNVGFNNTILGLTNYF